VSQNSEESPADEGPYRWYVLGLLIAVYSIHHLDRQVVALLQEPIRQEFDLNDKQLGLVTGTAYAIAFGIAGIPLGMLVDRIHRVRLLAGLIVIWSGLTALCATAGGFVSLVVMRVGVGSAESGSTPTNMSLLGDYFSRSRQSTAVGLYMMGPQLGTLIGFAVTGIIAYHWGWRAAFLMAGLPGITIALLLLATVREPRRHLSSKTAETPAAPPEPAPAFSETMKHLWSDRGLFHGVVALTLANFTAAALFSWLPPFVMRVHEVDIAQAGITIALFISSFAAIGSVIAGAASDKFRSRNIANMSRLMAVASLITVPCLLFGVFAQSFLLTIFGFSVMTFAHMFINTPGYALAIARSPSRMRGSTIAVLQVLSNVLGFGLGPFLGGFLSDLFAPTFGTDSLRYALAIVVIINLWAAAHAWRSAVFLARKSEGEAAVT